jgi:hypothetical protein
LVVLATGATEITNRSAGVPAPEAAIKL